MKINALRIAVVLLVATVIGWELSSGPASAQQQQPAARPAQSKKTQPKKADTKKADTKKADTKKAEPAKPEPAEEKPLPKLADMKTPDVTTLLQGKPVCWVVTIKDEVIVSEPVKPRPRTREQMLKSIEDWPKGKSPAQRRAKKIEFDRLHFLTVVLPETSADEPEYHLPIRFLKNVVHHEDLMLKRIDLLMDASDFRAAFEMLLALERVAPPKRVGKKEVFWPGYVDRRNRLMLLEAERKIKQKRLQSALAYLFDLNSLKADPPTEVADERYTAFRQQLNMRFAKAVGDATEPLIASAVAAGDFHQARFFLRDRLRALVPAHPAISKWQGMLESRQQNLLGKAAAATAASRHDQAALLADQAIRVWPAGVKKDKALNVNVIYTATSRRFQTLTVGVVKLAGSPSGCPFPTESDRRHHELLTQTLFHVERFENIPYYKTDYFERFEPTDLGRQVEFALRPAPASWQAGPGLSSAAIVSMLSARIDPQNRHFDERLATFVSGLSVRSPREFRLRFSRVPVSPEALLKIPVVAPAPADQDGQQVLSRRFRVHDRNERRAVYRREIPEPDGLPGYHVAEIKEIRYDTYEKALQAMLRGEFAVLPRMPSWHVETFRTNKRLLQQFRVLPYAVSTTHVIQFNPRSQPLKNHELRKSLAVGLDRTRILAETVLRDSQARVDSKQAQGRVISAPYPSRSYAYFQQNRPRPHNPILAISLATVAANRLGGKVPALKMVCSTEPIVHAAATQLVAQWKRVGLEVTLLDSAAQASDDGTDWDLAYRTLHMTEPIVELWPFLTMQPVARVADLMYLPDWLRQELINLDRAENFQLALKVLQRLHRNIQEQVLVLPLWEVDEVMVLPRNIEGFPQKPLSPYQGLERWVIQPQSPQDAIPRVRPQ